MYQYVKLWSKYRVFTHVKKYKRPNILNIVAGQKGQVPFSNAPTSSNLVDLIV